MRIARSFVVGLVAVALSIDAFAARAEPPANPPGLMFSTVLNGLKTDARRGAFYVDQLQAVFLPPAESKSIYPYNPDDGGKLWATLQDGAGAELARFDFYGEKREPPFWLLGSYKLSGPAKPSDGGKRLKLAKGDYVLEFFVEGTRFYRFPFAIDVISSGDAFAPEDYTFVDGDWSNWGYLYYPDANPEQNIEWKTWLRNKAHERSKDVKISVEVRRGKKLICVSRPGTTHTLQPEWTRFAFGLVNPPEGTSGGGYFKAKDLLATDGAYTLDMAIDGKPYGQWSFTVKGGKLQYAGRAERGGGDPLTFIEGGRDAWWYGK